MDGISIIDIVLDFLAYRWLAITNVILYVLNYELVDVT